MRRDLIERDEDEGALGQAGVGNFQIRFADAEIAVEENIEIEGARTVGETRGAVAAKLLFDGQQGVEQRARSELGFKSDDSIYEAGLRGETDGRGGVERGARGDSTERGETHGGCGQRGVGLAGVAGQVGAETDVSRVHLLQGIARRGVTGGRTALSSSSLQGGVAREPQCVKIVFIGLLQIFGCVFVAGSFCRRCAGRWFCFAAERLPGAEC